MPGVSYTREVQLTAHGPVALNVLVAPRPGGLWNLAPVLSDGAISGRERLTAIERGVSDGATVAGVNGDFFNAATGEPAGILLHGGVLQATPDPDRSSIGIGPDGTLSVDQVAFYGFWQGRGQRRVLSGVNQPPPRGGVTIYTPSWGATTPASPGALEAVVYPFPPTVPGPDLTGTVVQYNRDGNTPIPPGGAVFSGRGGGGNALAQEAPPGAQIKARVTLQPDWTRMADALGGGPALVRAGRPVFRAFEDFLPSQIAPRMARTAVGQRRDGSIVLLAVDGARPGYSVGMTNFELASALVRLGVVTGSGLDSGDSTAMAFDGQLLNRPSDPSGERAVADALLVFYYGVYAPAPAAPVLSPNGDGVNDKQSVAFKVVRASDVVASIVGPDGAARFTSSGPRAPGTYKFSWPGTKPDGTSEVEGAWHWSVSATDDLGRHSTTDQPFWLNNTLAGLRTPATAVVRARHKFVVASFDLAHPARVSATIETKNGTVLGRIVQESLAAGPAKIVWDGRLGPKRLLFGGRYVVRVRATNQYGPTDLTAPLAVRRR
jgi:hypothetical protein